MSSRAERTEQIYSTRQLLGTNSVTGIIPRGLHTALGCCPFGHHDGPRHITVTGSLGKAATTPCSPRVARMMMGEQKADP